MSVSGCPGSCDWITSSAFDGAGAPATIPIPTKQDPCAPSAMPAKQLLKPWLATVISNEPVSDPARTTLPSTSVSPPLLVITAVAGAEVGRKSTAPVAAMIGRAASADPTSDTSAVPALEKSRKVAVRGPSTAGGVPGAGGSRRVAVRGPSAAGAKVTWSATAAPLLAATGTWSDAETLAAEMAKSPGLAPAMAMSLMVSGVFLLVL